MQQHQDNQQQTQEKSTAMLRPSGGYRFLKSYQMAEIVFDATVAFCEHNQELTPRYRDQMVQAARSGRQNIAEGSCAAATSSKSEVLLTNVARSSLEELLLDYEDYLRHHELPQWDKDNSEAVAVRQVCKTHGPEIKHYRKWLKNENPAVVANALICLCNQAIYLLKRQINTLEARHREQGGYGEQLYAARIARREERQAAANVPECPECGKPMKRRTARQGIRAGKDFWGCSAFPKCRGTRNINEE